MMATSTKKRLTNTTMTEFLSISDMFEGLMQNYDELYHDDDEYNPEGYEEYLNSLTDDEFTALCNDTFNY